MGNPENDPPNPPEDGVEPTPAPEGDAQGEGAPEAAPPPSITKDEAVAALHQAVAENRSKKALLESVLAVFERIWADWGPEEGGPSGPGRKTLLTPEMMDDIVVALTAGNTIKDVCHNREITTRTFERWMVRGLSTKKKDALYRQFRKLVKKAHAPARERLVTNISLASETDWRAGAWLLERKFPNRFGLQINQKVTSELSKALDRVQHMEIDPSWGPDETKRRVFLAIAGVAGAGES